LNPLASGIASLVRALRALTMQSKIISRRDLDFLLYEWLNAEALTSRARYADHSR
jgi:hypothetical protein